MKTSDENFEAELSLQIFEGFFVFGKYVFSKPMNRSNTNSTAMNTPFLTEQTGLLGERAKSTLEAGRV